MSIGVFMYISMYMYEYILNIEKENENKRRLKDAFDMWTFFNDRVPPLTT